MCGLHSSAIRLPQTHDAPNEIGAFHEAPRETGWQQWTQPFRIGNRFTPGCCKKANKERSMSLDPIYIAS